MRGEYFKKHVRRRILKDWIDILEGKTNKYGVYVIYILNFNKFGIKMNAISKIIIQNIFPLKAHDF